MVAINAFPAYLRAQPPLPEGGHATASLADLLDSIDYAVKLIGIDHVGISSDFNHGGGVEGWSNVGETANVTAGLRRRGYTQPQINKLRGGNVMRI